MLSSSSSSILPSLLVDEGARRLALAHLEAANAIRSRVSPSTDPEALHDYRVALRRLRSCLRAYQRTLQSTLRRRSLRRLRRLARGTNRSRDLEVHLAWLIQQRDEAGEAERPGVSWVFERLTRAERDARDEMLRLDHRLFPEVHDRLAAELTEFRVTIRLDGDLRRRSVAAATGDLARELSERLKQRLVRIHGFSSERAIHRARIGAKHLRYLIEPFAGAVPDGAALVDRLKKLQDAFGDVHDAHVFLAELHEMIPEADGASSSTANFLPGIEALMVSLVARGRQAFTEASHAWLDNAAGPFFQKVAALADDVSHLADRNQEVEGAVLLTGLPRLGEGEGSEQGEQIVALHAKPDTLKVALRS